MTTRNILLIMELNLYWMMTGYAAPLSSVRNSWDKDILVPLVKSACLPNGRCWEVLPAPEVIDDEIILPADLETTRLQARRQITDTVSDSTSESSKDVAPTLETEVRTPIQMIKRIPSKMAKQDALPSHSWGAGGMPFSVLYMRQHGSRSNRASTSIADANHQQEIEKTNKNSTPPLTHPNYRSPIRNGAWSQTRRQYPIIPHLFVSYGWETLGK